MLQILAQYLTQLQCPVAYSQQTAEQVLLWLLRYAVHLEYTDAGGHSVCHRICMNVS